ncbi:LytR/AlgR family response regulator transcription factor [Polluticoccus soli]|uniref:LytR/AlgR family response regulator transcription factor n=1 Tax=Polluticoccus soli TaxID=3034150 RepID=UPI0023E289AE|nr:LytTR family DNA-binding domain-containing protein [Flavipsychrobacter sp. JY13-12]
MRALTCLIVDDEPLARSIIESYLKQLDNFAAPVQCNNALEALKLINEGFRPDVMFLDINMPVISGIDFLRSLKEPPPVVLTTAHREFAVDAFELHALDYLVKPISFDRFLKTVQRIYDHYSMGSEPVVTHAAKRDYIFLKQNAKMLKVNFDDILYVEANKDYINVCTPGKKMLVSMSLKEIEEELPADTFIRVHRSYIVNVHKIQATYGNVIEVEGQEIPIGTNYKEAFMKAVMDGSARQQGA